MAVDVSNFRSKPLGANLECDPRTQISLNLEKFIPTPTGLKFEVEFVLLESHPTCRALSSGRNCAGICGFGASRDVFGGGTGSGFFVGDDLRGLSQL